MNDTKCENCGTKYKYSYKVETDNCRIYIDAVESKCPICYYEQWE